MITIKVRSGGTLIINECNETLILNKIDQLGKKMANQQADIDGLTAQVEKVNTEIQGLKTKLEDAIAGLEAQIEENVTLDLGPLKTAVQVIDDIVQDVVA